MPPSKINQGPRKYVKPNRTKFAQQKVRGLVPAARHVSRAPELKSMDVAPNTQVLNTAANFDVLNAVPVGSAFYNRIGNKISMKSLELRGYIAQTANAGTGVAEYIRIVILYDAQANGAYPTWADIFTSYAGDGTTTSTSVDFLNINNRERFKILMDDTICVTNNANTALTNATAGFADYTKNEVNIHRYIRLKNMVCNYKGSTSPGIIGDIATGSLILVTLGNIVSGMEKYNLQWASRLRYYDS